MWTRPWLISGQFTLYLMCRKLTPKIDSDSNCHHCFYSYIANIVAVNANTYFLPFKSPDFFTVFTSWLNLDIGFDVCFRSLVFNELLRDEVYKALLHLLFPTYIISLVFIVLVASHYSTKFAKLIGKGNPVAVLATMILLSYARVFVVLQESVLLSYSQLVFGSRHLDVTRYRLEEDDMETASSAAASDPLFQQEVNGIGFYSIVYFMVILSILIFLSGMIFTVLVFSWQWLL